MASIRSRDTRPELALRHALVRSGLRGYRCHVPGVAGRPDVVFTRWRIAVFVDGVWWHGHPGWFTPGRRGPYWDRKIAGNVDRDRRVDAQLRSEGWFVIRIWDVDVLAGPDVAAERVAEALRARGRRDPAAAHA